ncbi:dihydrodipicolinate synthase family protein [Ornithinicoccus halotolerans]|uniref:dihydrodipicolinate synthase family protein n=1 Tax=Ornithinicoccus halotolerans TaxID=1748220 RepID=UPI001296A982|nr:dihydrodipicolinate synthase family protein [Ornithinicoccus halotolerans]
MLDGVYVANVTPFDPGTGALDVASYCAHVEWLAEAGVHGVVPFGTNGEGPSASVAEKQQVLAALARRDLPLRQLPTVAEGNLPDTLDMLEFLDDLDVEAVLVLPPYYFPAQPEGLRRFYELVLERTRHPVVVYHIPKYALAVPAEVVTGLPVWGVKDSGGEAAYAAQVHAAGQGVLLGTEDDYPGRLGTASAVVSALANVVPEVALRVYGLVRAGKQAEAEEANAWLRRIRAATKEHASAAVLKAMAQARHGVPMGTVRLPMLPLPGDYDAAAVLADLGVQP